MNFISDSSPGRDALKDTIDMFIDSRSAKSTLAKEILSQMVSFLHKSLI